MRQVRQQQAPGLAHIWHISHLAQQILADFRWQPELGQTTP